MLFQVPGSYVDAFRGSSPGAHLEGLNHGELKELQEELYSKMFRRLKAKTPEQKPEDADSTGEFPVHSLTYTRRLENGVVFTPKPRSLRERHTPFATTSTRNEHDHDGITIPTIPADSPGVFGSHSSPFHLHQRSRPKSAPAKNNVRSAYVVPRDSLTPQAPTSFHRHRSTGVFGSLDPHTSGVLIRPQSTSLRRASVSSADALDVSVDDQDSSIYTAISQISSDDAAARVEGALALSSLVVTASLAASLVYSGALDAICAAVKGMVTRGDGGSTTCVQLLGVVFRVGAVEQCCRAAGEAVCKIVGETRKPVIPNGMSGGSSLRGLKPQAARAAASRWPSVPKGVWSSALASTPSSHSGIAHFRPGTSTHAHAHAHETPKHEGKELVSASQHMPGSSQPAKRQGSDDAALRFVAGGSLLWVIPGPDKSSGKPRLCFVQLLPTGELYVQGVQQKVVVTGAMPGMSEHVKSFSFTSSQRAGCFRMTAVEHDGNNDGVPAPEGAEEEKRGSRVLDFRAPAASDMVVWVRGVQVVADMTGASHREKAAVVHDKSLADLCRQVCCDELHTVPDMYHGERDESSLPRGRATATWANGTRHTGMWRNGEPHGKGLLSLSGGQRYAGEFEEGVPNGYGVLFGSSDDKFEGEWSSNARNGFGCEYQGRRLTYCGGYAEGLREGEGIAFAAVGQDGGYQPLTMCVYSDGILEHSYMLSEDEKMEDKEVYMHAVEAARMAREAVVDVAKIVKEIQDLGHLATMGGMGTAGSSLRSQGCCLRESGRSSMGTVRYGDT